MEGSQMSFQKSIRVAAAMAAIVAAVFRVRQ